MSISPVLTSGLGASSTADSSSNSKSPEKIREAASQFEGLLIGQMLKSMHEDEEGFLGTGEDQSAASAMGMADEYLAQSISKNGGLGLAQMISRQLDSSSSAASVNNSTFVNSSNSATRLAQESADSVNTNR